MHIKAEVKSVKEFHFLECTLRVIKNKVQAGVIPAQTRVFNTQISKLAFSLDYGLFSTRSGPFFNM